MTLLKRKLSLLVKFNGMFLLLFGSGWITVTYLCNQLLQSNAQKQVMSQAQLIMDYAIATRSYTTDEVGAILDRIGTDSRTFLPQTVPAHAAAATFRYLQAQYSGYQYKEPALSPTNLLDEPTPWEKTVIQLFQAHPDQRTDTGDVPDADEPRLYVARPLTAKQPCLRCHNTPDSAPAAMTAKYGRSYGFNWKVNEVIAAQIVIVPKRVQSEEARKDFELLSSYLAIMFVIIVGIVDFALLFVVIRPIRALLSRTELISRGEVVKEDMPVKGNDEIADLSRSFNRLQHSITAVMKLLDHTK